MPTKTRNSITFLLLQLFIFLFLIFFNSNNLLLAHTIELLPEVCGNGLLEPGEECDDGNLMDGDGCNSTCAFEITSLSEPNHVYLPEEIAKKIITILGITPSSKVTISGPVSPGSQIREDVRGQTTLDVPNGAGPYYVVFIDDMPNFLYTHPVRYAWYNSENGTHSVVNANWPFTIYPQDRSPTPYVPMWSNIFNGVEVTFGTGDFAGEVVSVPANLTGNIIKHNLLKKATTLLSKLLIPEAHATTKDGSIRAAFIFDGGDKNSIFGTAYELSKNADLIESYLKKLDVWSIKRFSNYWGKEVNDDVNRIWDRSFNEVFRDYIEKLSSTMEAQSITEGVTHHELFIYITAHGYSNGMWNFTYFNPDGKGDSHKVEDSSIIRELKKLPAGKVVKDLKSGKEKKIEVTVYFLIDSCQSGALIRNANALIPGVKDLANDGKYVYAITSTNANNFAVSGHTFYQDSGTEDFNQGLSSDGDGDKKSPNDIGDGFAKMYSDGWVYNRPQRFVSPAQFTSEYYSLELQE